MIEPTVGRIVLYHYGPGESRHHGPEAWPAIVTKVHGHHSVNLTVFAPDGVVLGKPEVRLVQADEEAPDGEWCEWMPYQIGQAARTEAAEKKLAEKPPNA